MTLNILDLNLRKIGHWINDTWTAPVTENLKGCVNTRVSAFMSRLNPFCNSIIYLSGFLLEFEVGGGKGGTKFVDSVSLDFCLSFLA